MTIIKFDTNIDVNNLTHIENNDCIQIKYSNDNLILESCLLSVQSINKQNNLSIVCSFNERSEYNKAFLNKMLLIEDKFRTFNNKQLVKCINRQDNIYYINLTANKDTLFFNKYKKQVSGDNIFINAIVKCLLEINYLDITDETMSYELYIKQILIGNSL